MQTVIHEIAKDFYLIKSQESDFHRNIYLRTFKGNGSQINMIFDPGTRLDMPMISEAANQLIGGIPNIHIIFLSHQDPDVTSNTPAIMQLAPRSVVISSIDTWRLIKMYGIPENRFRAAESFRNAFVSVKSTGHKLQMVPARYCHFRGALMVYDLESRVLFTGDLFGGLNTRKSEGIWADESSWEGIALFHQIYMPLKPAIVNAVDRISCLTPEVQIIAPQHGDVLRGDHTMEFAARLSQLEVAADLNTKPDPNKELLLLCLNEFLDAMRISHPAECAKLTKGIENPRGFTTLFALFNGSIVDVKVGTQEAIVYFAKCLRELSAEGPEAVSLHETLFASSLHQYGLALPDDLTQRLDDLEEDAKSEDPFE